MQIEGGSQNLILRPQIVPFPYWCTAFNRRILWFDAESIRSVGTNYFRMQFAKMMWAHNQHEIVAEQALARIELNYMSNCFREKSMEESIVRLLQWTWMQIVQVEWTTYLLLGCHCEWLQWLHQNRLTDSMEKANSKTTTKSQTRIERKVLC